MTGSTSLAIIGNNPIAVVETDPARFFTPNGLDPVIDAIRAEVTAAALDMSTPKGRKEIASLARKIASSKVALDDMGKAVVVEQKATIAAVDTERKRMRDTLDHLRDDTRRPLTEWEEKDEKRVAEHEAALAELAACNVFDIPAPSSADIQARIDQLAAFQGRGWEEFQERAVHAFTAATAGLISKHTHALAAETQHAELERLLKAEQERLQAERDERLKQEAADAARLAAEAAAKAEADRIAAATAERELAAERERERIEHEKARAVEERKAAEERAAKADADRIAADVKARKGAIEAEQRAKKAAAEAEAAAIQRERERVAAEEQRLAVETAKREANKKHRAKINGEAFAVIVAVLNTAISPTDQAKAVIEAIAHGEIPHISITY